MPRFAANLTMMFNEWPFLDRFAAAADAGFDAVEFLFPYAHAPDVIADRLAAHRLTVALFNMPPGDWEKGERGLAALPDRFGEFRDGVDEALIYAKATGVGRLHMMAGIADPIDPGAVASYRRALDHAAAKLAAEGVELVIEPINGRDMPGYFLNDFGLAQSLIEQGTSSAVRLQFDVYHRQIMHGDVTVALRRLMPLIGHVQISSVPSRHEPDGEELNYPFIFAEIDRLGYAGFVGCEYRPRGETLDGLSWFSGYGGAMKPILLGCIADDYTGASDLANTLTRAGLRTLQTIGAPDADVELPEADAIVIALKIRSAPPADAVAKARQAHAWLKARGARHVMFKICSTFDSTDVGNIGPVSEALRSDVGAGTVLVTPAFPQTGRTVFMGHLFVGEVLLSESPLKDHPLNPMRDANLVRVLARQSVHPVGLIALADVAKGAEEISARLAAIDGTGAGAAIVDAVFNEHLDAIASVALQGPLSIGASGLGLGLARRLAASRVQVSSASDWASEKSFGGSLACLSGSCSAATLEQIDTARRVMPVFQLEPGALLEGGDEVGRALDWAKPRLKDGPLLIASSASADQVQDLQGRFGREASGQALEQALASIAQGLAEMGVRRFIVAGGETSGAVVDKLGVRALAVGPEIAPGVPVMRVIGGAHDDMLLTLKSGNFGGPDFFAKAIGQMSRGG